MVDNVGNNYVLICNDERVEELNERILARMYPDRTLDTQFQFRSQPTRYVYLPTVDKNQCIVSEKQPPYSVKQIFNPGTRNGPWSGFVDNVDNESILRNQLVPLQNNDHLTYIPKDTSDLYTNTIRNNAEVPSLLHSRLFEKPDLSGSQNELSNNNMNLAINLFNNDTRQQLKNS